MVCELYFSESVIFVKGKKEKETIRRKREGRERGKGGE